MAIAGLQNVPVIEASILRDSQSSSSGHIGNQGSISTRASSIRQMWLEREDECVVNRGHGRRSSSRVNPENNNNGLLNCPERESSRGGMEDSSESENGSVINPDSVTGHSNDHDDHQSMTSEQSQDLGLVERERVRRIFQEWKNNGGASQASSGPHRNRGSRGQWLGETERERVRVVREWIQTTSRSRDEQVSEVGSQIDQVVENNEGPPENIRRPIRRLCGRQALLDLLAKKERERQQELQGLEVSQPVTRFAHRNRIQSLLRLRCFQNMRAFELRSPRSTESELGLLRQRQTVSGLRGGFFSRLDNNVQAQVNDLSGNSSENNAVSPRDDQSHANTTNEIVVVTHQPSNSTNETVDNALEQSALPSEVHDIPQERNEPSVEIGCPQQNESFENLNGICLQSDPQLDSDVGPSVVNNDECTSLQQLEAQDEENRSDITSSEPLIGSSNDVCLPMNSQEPSRSGSGEFSDDIEETREMSDHSDTQSDVTNIHDDQLNDGVQVLEDVNGQESVVQVEDWSEQVSMFEESRWQGSVLSTEWRDEDRVERERENWGGDGEEVSHGGVESEVGEPNEGQEDYWHENGSLETPRDWLGIPLSSGVTSGRLDTYYFSDDDNSYHMELRELVNRRRVSSLLHSEFRESLDQLIQSYVERQTNVPEEWELHEMSLPHFTTQNQDHVVTYNGEDSEPEIINVEPSQRTLPRPPPLPHTHWGRRPTSSRRACRQRPGTEWEIINDLRIDMARLQQRLNNMQRMLETCMDMQLELQRSVRQEVSAALNRTTTPSELPENALPKESFKWDCVRKGICCICSNTNIDSLLYRCGHMCTCTKCADQLIQGNGKCPMCQAPVIEVIRAYFIQ